MAIFEREPWACFYFDTVSPADQERIPTHDVAAWTMFPQHRWVYNKLLIAESQGLECAPHGVTPPRFPVFSKPITNLGGMGKDSRVFMSAEAYEAGMTPGHFWSTYLRGRHISTDLAIENGKIKWSRHTEGMPGIVGTFDYWHLLPYSIPDLDAYLTSWIDRHLSGFTGMMNIETIDNRIIETHLRAAFQWHDLYGGTKWVEAVAGLYRDGVWRFDNPPIKDGYSVVLFGPHGRRYRYPDPAIRTKIMATPGISNVYYSFDEKLPPEYHSMPPGGFRLAVINCHELAVGRTIRRQLMQEFGLVASVAGGA